MTLTPFEFDIAIPLTALERMKLSCMTVHAKWKFRNYAQEDRRFIERLINTGVEVNTIWDVGASNGAWALMVCSELNNVRIEMFEPLVPFDKSYYDVMRYRLHAHENWYLHPYALGAEDSQTAIYKSDSTYGSSMIDSAYAREQWEKVHVSVRSMDSLILNDGIKTPDVLKADVQGFEMHVLNGGEESLGNVKALLLESWLSRGYGPETPLLKEMEAWLNKRGFIIAEINDCYRDPLGQQHSVDAFFVSNDIAPLLGINL